VVRLLQKSSRYTLSSTTRRRRHIPNELQHLVTQTIKEKLMTNTIELHYPESRKSCNWKKISYSKYQEKAISKEDG